MYLIVERGKDSRGLGFREFRYFVTTEAFLASCEASPATREHLASNEASIFSREASPASKESLASSRCFI
jgi:hypothetical protein